MRDLRELETYEIVKEEEIPEVNGKGYILSHKKTKARVLVIANDDENKVFDIGFRTPPYDDSGIPHILEHSVLCGSRKYPVKDPFVELAKGSLNTFLNAMTYSDKTVYPIASCNEKDFENLMDVYLDAVFYPNIYNHTEIMRQEGWHYELEDVDGELTYNGVVFNEMKGAFSSPEQQLYSRIEATLFADTPYGNESGGNPAVIPTLTQERFLDFHRTYYHPSNSHIYLYGNLDMFKELEYIDSEYLSKFEYKEIDSTIAHQKPFAQMKDITCEYSIAENESEENHAYLTYNMVVGESIDKKQVLAMNVIEYAIMDAPGAPLKKALVDAEIGEDVFASYDDGIQQTSFSIVAKNANGADKDRFVSIIRETLSDLSGHGEAGKEISKKSLEAAINNFEFKHKEANFGRYPKGLMMGLDAYNTWLYKDEAALEMFKLNEVYEELKNELDTGYFENLIWEKLVANNFGSVLVMEPKKGLDKETDAKEKKILADYKASCSNEELERLVEETKALKLYQETPSPAEDMKKIPLLSISDIRKEIHPLKNKEGMIQGIPLVSHDIFTNGIGYLDFIFNINDLDAELIPYAELLTSIFKYVDTEHYTYGELSNEINFHTGGIGFSTGAMYKNGTKDYLTIFNVKTKAMDEKLVEGLRLIEEILFTSNLADKKRLKEIISEEKAGLKSDLTASGHITTATRAMSYLSEVMAFKDLTEGIGYYAFLTSLDKEFDKKADEIIEKLQTALSEILRKGALTISYTGKNDISALLGDEIKTFVSRLSTRPAYAQKRKLSTVIKNEGFKTASQVQYVSLAGDYREKGFEYTGALEVLQVIFSYGYLWENIRVKGGAYGAMCSFTRSGMSYFTSYRDPNLMETYQIYQKAAEYVAAFDADERDMTKYLIGAIAKLDAPMTPSAEGAFSQSCYFAGITDEQLQKERDQVLCTDVAAIRTLAPLISAVTESGIICAVGGEDKIEKNRENFKEVKDL